MLAPGEETETTASVNFTDDPKFIGRLSLEATGMAGLETAFAIRAAVRVE